MNTKAFFPCGGGSNLILETGIENQIFFLRTPATVKFFHQIVEKLHFCEKKKNHYPPRWISVTFIWSPTLFPRGIIILKGVVTKFHFLTNFPHLEKFADLIKDLKYEHQSIFPLWWRVKPNFRDICTENHIFFLRTPAAIKFFTKFSKNDTLV